jgi:antitoxin MazE
MKTTLISIGNSRGVRIPKPFIEQCGLSETVEMDVRDSVILIRSPRQPRSGWDKAFKRMARLGDDKLLDSRTDDHERAPLSDTGGCTFQGREGLIVLDQIRTVDKERLVKKLGTLSPTSADRVLEVLAEMFQK